MKKLLLASSACAFACCVTPSLADGVSARFGGDFGNIAGSPYWDANGSVQIPFDWSDLSVQGDLGAAGAGGVHYFDGGGSAIWNGLPNLRLAGTVIFNQFTFGGPHVNETQFGGGAEWYASPWLTLSAQGGGLAGTDGGGYVGGTVKGYLMPNLSLAGNVTYVGLSTTPSSHETQYGATAEWLVSEEFPVSLNGSYQHDELAISGFGHGHTDIWTVGLKLYLNDTPARTLVDRNRTGVLDTIGTPLQVRF